MKYRADNTKTLRIYITVLLAVLVAVSSRSITADANIHVERFGVRDGLSDNTITSICRDSKGFMWFGTSNGLNRFDGYNYIHYKHDLNDSTSISDNYIRDIIEDKSGVLWIGTLNGGLNRFNRDSETFIRYNHNPFNPAGISSSSVKSITEGKDGTIWIGTDSGVNVLDRENGTFRKYYHDPADSQTISSNNIGCVFADNNGNIWIGSTGGLDVIAHENGTIKRLADRNSATSKYNQNIIDITEGNNGILWLSTWGGGLRKYDTRSGTYDVFLHDPGNPDSILSNIVGHMSFDNNGILWFGTARGIHSIDPSNNMIQHYSHDPTDPFSLSTDSIWAVYHDTSGIGWVGTLYGGGNKIVPSKSIFRLYNLGDIYDGATKGGNITEFCEIGSSLWFTSNYGLHSFDTEKQKFSTYAFSESNAKEIEALIITSILNDNDGHLWLGTTITGLIQFNIDTGLFSTFKRPPNRDSYEILGITLEDNKSDGLLWLGTDKGILTFDPQTEQYGTIDLSDDDNSKMEGAANIIFDKDGRRVWISGTFGFSQYDRVSHDLGFIYSKYQGSRSLSSNFIVCMLDDGRGGLWLGTNDGLYSYDKESEEHTRYTLPNDTIHGLVKDKNDNIWVSTNTGLSCVNVTTKEVLNYDAEDGLPSDLNLNLSMFCRSDGTIFVGGQNGFYTFQPDSILVNNSPPSVVITSLRIGNVEADFGKDITELKEIELPYEKSPITIEFAALDFTNPASNIYEYTMEGINDEWIQSGTERKVTYNNIAPGSYSFRVKAANSLGEWNHAGATLRITIIPPFWKTVWFKLIVAVSLAAAVFGIYNARVIAIKHQREHLQMLVDQQTLKLREINEKLEQLAITDALTDINNRRNFNAYINSQWKTAIREKTPISLIIADIDDFKKYNDFYGHQKGDQCLYRVAQILKKKLNRPRDFVARYGGEEFVVVLPDSTTEGAKHVADSLIEGIRHAAILHEKSEIENIVTLSLGIATVCPDASNSPDTLTKMADDALYEAKNKGKNQAVSYSA